MGRFALVEAGKVVNVILLDDPDAEGFEDAIEVSDEVGLDWSYVDGEFIAPPAPNPGAPIVTPPVPNMTGSAGFTMADGIITGVELGALVAGAYYEQGYVQVYFLETQTLPYLVFVQTDLPCKVEQYKEPGALELVFSDPLTGNPIDLGRIDLQILNVR